MSNFCKFDKLTEYFEKNKKNDEIFFYRLSKCDDDTEKFIMNFYELAKKEGSIIKNRLPNPTDLNVQYYNDIIGEEFRLNQSFFIMNFQKWIPSLPLDYAKSIALEMFIVMADMRKLGKTDGIIKSVYIKYMCWLYYNFQNAVLSTIKNKKACVIFQGDLVLHELNILNFLAKIGCDVIVIYSGENYEKIDANSEKSIEFTPNQPAKKCDLDEIIKKIEYKSISPVEKVLDIKTNNKSSEDIFEQILEPIANRGEDSNCCYNFFYKVKGVDDIVYFKGKLHGFLEKIQLNRALVCIDENLNPPLPNEMSEIKLPNTSNNIQLLKAVVSNISYPENNFIEKIIRSEFVAYFEQKASETKENLFKTQVITIFIWLNKFKNKLFKSYKPENIPIMVNLNGASNVTQKMFFEFMSKLPIDVLILCPDLEKAEITENAQLIEYPNTYKLEKLPVDQQGLVLSTVAFNASQEIDTILYSDGMMFRDYQSTKANSVILQTIFEEIKILWEQPAQFRPNFESLDQKLTLPVICAKVNGTLNLTASKYWNEVQSYITKDTYIVKKMDFSYKDPEALRYSSEFFKKGKLLKAKIKEHKCYKYAHLREEVQEHILEKLEILINSKIIKGTLEFGTEYTIIAMILALDKQIERLLQKYDFNKEIPKVIIVDADETQNTLEDAIIVAFLNLVGFDVIVFSPSGYLKLENSYNYNLFQQYTIGELAYDLTPPNLKYIERSKLQFNFFRRK